MRLTVGQAVVRFLGQQLTERDGMSQPMFAGCLGIFGHGNVAGIGQALLQDEKSGSPSVPYVLARNEQAMVHTATAFARAKDRLQMWACTSSVGPGSTNMVTGAALATVNRLPVLLLPSGTFATRATGTVLQQLESPQAGDVTVNDAFRPVSRYFDRISRPEQLPSALLEAMRVLTDPADTGAVTLALPQDVQAEAYDWPAELFAERTWHIARPPAEDSVLEQAAEIIRSAKRPLIVAGGGVHYSGAEQALADFCHATGIAVGETQAGKGSLLHKHPQLLGAVGSTGTTAANAFAHDADVVVGVGTRWSDFTTASRTAFQDKGVRFININVARFDAGKHSGLAVVGDARETLNALTARLEGYRTDAAYADRASHLWAEWSTQVDQAYNPPAVVTDQLADGVLTQSQVLGAVNELSDPRDVVVCAAGSMPGDLHKVWRVRDHHGYHVEYGYSCMGYEIPGGIGVALAEPDRDVFVMVGDGSYLMMPTELVTALQERIKIIVVIVQNYGFHSIGALSESLGSQRFGTSYRYRTGDGTLDGDRIPIDLAANARSLGATVREVRSAAELADGIRAAKAAPQDRPFVLHVETDPRVFAPDNGAWWDVPVAQVSDLESTRTAYQTYVEQRRAQRTYLSPSSNPGEAAPPEGPDPAD